MPLPERRVFHFRAAEPHAPRCRHARGPARCPEGACPRSGLTAVVDRGTLEMSPGETECPYDGLRRGNHANGAGAGAGGADPNLPLHRPRGKHAAVGAAPGPMKAALRVTTRSSGALSKPPAGEWSREPGTGSSPSSRPLPTPSARVSTRRLASSASRGVRPGPYGCGWECTAAWPRRARATTTGPP